MQIFWLFAPLQLEISAMRSHLSEPLIPEFKTKKGHRVYRRFSSRPDGSKVYAETYTLRVRHGQKSSTYFKLGNDKREAGAKADMIMAFLAVDGNTVDEAQERFCPSKKHRRIRAEKKIAEAKSLEALTVGGMISKFMEVTSHLSPVTRRNNIQSLRHFAAGVMGLKKLGNDQTKAQQKEWRSKVESFPMDDFTVQSLEMFRQRELNACDGDHKKRGSTSTTLNSYLRAAKGVFSKKLMPHYEGLALPAEIPFRLLSPLPEPSHRYHSKIDAAFLVPSAKSGLSQADPDSWIVFLLVFGAGLRREEVDKLLWEQVDFTNRRIHIRTTEFFRPKAKNSDSWVDISEDIAAHLTAHKKNAGERRFVLPGREVGGKIRCQKIFRRLMSWLKSQGVTERTPLHTLRKEAGSMIFLEGGSIDRTAEFLRNDPRVAREHYIGRKERIELALPGL